MKGGGARSHTFMTLYTIYTRTTTLPPTHFDVIKMKTKEMNGGDGNVADLQKILQILFTIIFKCKKFFFFFNHFIQLIKRKILVQRYTY